MRISSTIRRAMQVSGARVATDYLDRQQTWHEFGARIARLAGALVEHGVAPGDRIAILSQCVSQFFSGKSPAIPPLMIETQVATRHSRNQWRIGVP